MSRWAHWSRGTEEKGKSFSSFLKEDLPNTGNPSAAMGPAERAASLGLQSNGKGGYIDPNTGQVVARTVNNELIFYDNNRATGGAISDSSGGAALTQAQPSWADPLTGMLTTPPSKAETPSEIAAIPDPTPATAPFGYNAFMKQKKMAAYQQNAVDPQPSRVTPDEMEQGDANQQQAFAAEESLGEASMGDALRRFAKDKGVDPAGLQARMGEAPPSSIKANVEKARAQQSSPDSPVNPGAPPRGYRKGHPQFRDYDAKLAAFQAAGGAQKTAPQVQQKDTQTPAQPAITPEPNPKKEGEPDLDSILSSIRGGETTQKDDKAKTALGSMSSQTKTTLDVDGDGDVDREDVKEILTKLSSTIEGKRKNGKLTKKAQAIIDRLSHPIAGPRIKKFIGAMIDQDKRLRTQHEQLSRFSDEDGALQFLTEGVGLKLGENGRLSMGEPNRELRALGGAGMPGEGRGESRAIGFRELQSLLDPTRAQLLMDAQNDETGAGARFLHKNALQNDVSWDMATKLYDRLERNMQSKLDGWGKPEAAQGTFTPLGPVEFLKDADGNFTGETNIDALARTDPEEYAKHFSTDNAGNRNRGIFNLMKYLAQGGKGEFSGLPAFFDFDTSTPDHIMGRSSGALPNNRAKDDPLNLAFDRRGLNQFKVSSQYENEDGERERDTIGSLLNAVKGVTGSLGNVGYDEEDFENMSDSPNFLKYLAYRLEQSDFDPTKIEQRSGGGGLDQYPDSIEDFLGLDDNMLKSLVGKNERKNPLGLNMRNFSMLAPRAGQRPLTTNTWGGAPGGGLEYNPLVGYRRAMAASALFDPAVKEELTRFEEEQSQKKNMTPEKLEKLVQKKRRDLIAHSHFGPQKAAASLYGMGQIGTEQFIDRLRELSTGKLEFMRESNPEAYEKLIEGLTSTLDDYRIRLDEKMPDGPYRFTEEELMPNLSQPYIREVMGSNFGRQFMPRALIEAFDAIKGNEKYRENMGEGLSLQPNKKLL